MLSFIHNPQALKNACKNHFFIYSYQATFVNLDSKLNINLRLHIEMSFHASGYSCQLSWVFLFFPLSILLTVQPNLPKSNTWVITMNLMPFFNRVFCNLSYSTLL